MAEPFILAPGFVVLGDRVVRNRSVRVEPDGTIGAVGTRDDLTDDHPDLPVESHPDSLLVPGTVNVHNHSYQSLGRGLADDRTFDDWCDEGIYWLSEQLTEDDIYTGALLAFGEMLRYGVTTVCDFFYLHHDSNDPSRQVIRAAEDLGIRCHLARTMYDRSGGLEMYRESVDEATDRTDRLIREYENSETVDVSPAPHSPHAATPEMIRAGHDLARRHETKMHIHVAEVESEVRMTREEYGATPMRFLDDLGVVDDSTIAVHCVNLDSDEIRLMGEKGASLAYCPSSNMFLGDGVTDVPAFLDEEVRIGLGTDGGCSNNRTSVLEEMRMTGLLQKASRRDGTVCPAETTFAMGTRRGADMLQVDGGRIREGSLADFFLVNTQDPSMLPRFNLLKNLVYSLQPSAIQAVYVGGEEVVRDGELTRVSGESLRERVEELTARLRSAR